MFYKKEKERVRLRKGEEEREKKDMGILNTKHKFYIAFRIQEKIRGMKYDVKKRAFILKQAFSL